MGKTIKFLDKEAEYFTFTGFVVDVKQRQHTTTETTEKVKRTIVRITTEVFIQNLDGKEEVVDIEGDVSVRIGQVASFGYLKSKSVKKGKPIVLINHSTQKHTSIIADVDRYRLILLTGLKKWILKESLFMKMVTWILFIPAVALSIALAVVLEVVGLVGWFVTFIVSFVLLILPFSFGFHKFHSTCHKFNELVEEKIQETYRLEEAQQLVATGFMGIHIKEA